MNLDLKRLSLADVRLKIFTETESYLAAQFLELMELREQVRQAELSTHLGSHKGDHDRNFNCPELWAAGDLR
jgi:hypothetical protein